MGSSISSGNTTVTGTVSTTIAGTLPSPSAAQTLVKGVVNAGSSGATLYTVTAGKTFYCTGLHLSPSAASSMKIVIDGVDAFGMNLAINTGLCLTGGVLFSLAATKSVTITSNGGAATVYGSIWGYEV